MFYIIEKLEARMKELNPYRYMERQSLNNWKAKESIEGAEKYPPSITTDWQDFSLGDIWEGRDYYLWIQTTFKVPKSDGRIVLLLDFGRTGGGYNSGFESLLFVDGQPYQGVDSNHKEVFLDPGYYGKEVTLSLKLWSGLEGGGPEQIQSHTFKMAEYTILNEECDDLYFTADCVLKTIKQLKEDDSKRYELLPLLEKTMKYIDWSYPGSPAFYKSIKLANDNLQKGIDALDKRELVTITAIGHTHIDVAWLWRLKHTREKAARSFSTVLQLMKQYPDYIFLQTQPQLYQYIKEDYPEIYEQIKNRIEEGRWEIDGAMWLEADCNIPSGESLTRQILHGTQFIKKEFHKDVHYLWLPDVFGYSWALPQILKKSGIDTFMTTKISWNQYNRMPHDTFVWRGIDGSEVLTHFITTPEPGKDIVDNQWASRWFYTYNGQLEPETVLGSYKAYRNKDVNKQLLISYGYGDGGGGVTRDMLENRRRMDKIPGLPHVKTGRADEFFHQLHDTIDSTENYVHTWDGELYLEYHRGTYTSQAFVKKMNRRLELTLRELEILYTAVQDSKGVHYPKEEIMSIWEVLLRNQFHDIIPGSSIKEVYQDHKVEIGEAMESSTQLLARLDEATINQWTIFNSAGWVRKELVIIDKKESGKFITDSGEELEAVPCEAGYLVQTPNIPAFGTCILKFEPMEAKRLATPFMKAIENGIDTNYYLIRWNEKGQLISIYDKQYHREVLKENGLGNRLQLFEDKPMNFNAWDIDIFYQEKYNELAAESIIIKEQNNLYAKVEFVYSFGTSRIIQYMQVYKHSRRIDFITKTDWKEREQLLKAGFDVDIRNTVATYDIQYGNVQRPTHWNTSWDMAKFETVAHQWVDYSQRDYGVSILNDCKYGHDIKDQTMRITLLKGGIYPDPTADIGMHEFTYSLLPHKGDFVNGRTVEEAWALNQPLSVLQGKRVNQRLFKLHTAESVYIDAVKAAENGQGIILRLHDHLGSNRVLTLEPLFDCRQWNETNLLEEDMEPPVDIEGNITLELSPYEIKTIRIV
ncbi:alpha-mannosidase [Niallia circulans]|uniref:alpha-mannosidase n=1 Tax=Niallia circulans TaxID=1397 RepID=UPI00352C8D38